MKGPNKDFSNKHELLENALISRSASEKKHNRFCVRATHGMDTGGGRQLAVVNSTVEYQLYTNIELTKLCLFVPLLGQEDHHKN